MPHLDVSFFKKTFTCFSGMNIYENILFCMKIGAVFCSIFM